MPKKLDLRGYSSQGCVALRPAPNKGKYTAWYLECICGNEFIATTKRIRNGEVRSCGCLPPMKTKRAKRPKLKQRVESIMHKADIENKTSQVREVHSKTFYNRVKE